MAGLTRLGLYGGTRAAYPGFAPAGAVVTVSGTIFDAEEQDIRDGGRTILLTVANDTYVLGLFDSLRQTLINGLTSDGVEATGWNAEVRDKMPVTSVVRTSSTLITVTLQAAASYDIATAETITCTVSHFLLTSFYLPPNPDDDIVGTPTFAITPVEVRRAGGGRGRRRRKPRTVVIGGKRYTVWSPEEEKRLVEAYRAELEHKRDAAIAAGRRAEASRLAVSIKRTETRLRKVEDRRQAWIDELMREDEEVLMLLH